MRRAIALMAVPSGVLGASPVSKVVDLLKNMQQDLDAEGVADKAAQEKMECWCKDTKGDTTSDIEKSTGEIAAKSAEAAEQAGKASEASAKAKDAESKVAEARKALDDDTAARAKEQADFQETEKELVQSIGALESAVTVLSKHNSFMQVNSKDIKGVADILGTQLARYQHHHLGELTPGQRRSLEEFVQQPSYAGYQSQSGEIFGILNNMKDQFTADLAQSRGDEAQAVKTYGEQKKLREGTIKAQNAAYKSQSTKAANAKAASAAAEAAQTAAQESQTKAQALLDEATASCKTSADDHVARNKARALEQGAVAQALEFLNSDEAHAMFNKTFSFLQVRKVNASANRRALLASQRLQKAGNDYRSKDLLVLAQAIKAGAFDKVLHAIDDLVKELDETITSDAAKKDECTGTINDKTSKLNELKNSIEKLSAKRERLESKHAKLEEEIGVLNEEIAATQKDQKEASQAREVGNKEYQTSVADQTASIQILNQALTVLKNVYGTKSFLQTSTNQPAEFQDAGKHEGGNTVLSMISSIIADAEQAKALAIQDEQSAQKSYEAAMQGMNDLINTKSAEVSEKTGEKGQVGKELATTESTLTLKNDEKTSQETGLAAKQADCKFLFDNFQLRLDHMNGEKEALAEAKAFLNGMVEQ